MKHQPYTVPDIAGTLVESRPGYHRYMSSPGKIEGQRNILEVVGDKSRVKVALEFTEGPDYKVFNKKE
jgi:hypothetical protein